MAQKEEFKRIVSVFVAMATLKRDKDTELMIENALKNYQFSKSDVNFINKEASKGLEYCIGKIKDKKSKKLIYMELLKSAYLDGMVTASERDTLKKMGEKLNLSPNEQRKIENWVKKLLDEGKKLIEGND
ncbi:MAG: hypothetical protein ACP5KG_13120 [Myxococcota bacterium]